MSLLPGLCKRFGAARTCAVGITAALAAATLAAAPAQASTAASPESAAAKVPDGTERAMSADLGISRQEARERLRSQPAQDALADRLDEELGERAAGAFIERDTGHLVVNVTTARAARHVREANARARVVEHSMERLAKIKTALEDAAVTGTTVGIDVRSNSVDVSVPASNQKPRTQQFLDRAAAYGDAVNVTRPSGAPRAQALYGGEAIYGGGSRCSAAFATHNSNGTEYVLTAGHCTDAISSWDVDEGYLGPSVAASFPGNDYGAIRKDGSVSAVGQVIHNGGVYEITGAGNPPVGTYVCKTGSTTDTTCGEILEYGVTVNYPSGTVTDLIETDVCTEAGDSGGALYAGGNQAVGIVSGGSTLGCTSPTFRAYFENVTDALSAYGLTLK